MSGFVLPSHVGPLDEKDAILPSLMSSYRLSSCDRSVLFVAPTVTVQSNEPGTPKLCVYGSGKTDLSPSSWLCIVTDDVMLVINIPLPPPSKATCS